MILNQQLTVDRSSLSLFYLFQYILNLLTKLVKFIVFNRRERFVLTIDNKTCFLLFYKKVKLQQKCHQDLNSVTKEYTRQSELTMPVSKIQFFSSELVFHLIDSKFCLNLSSAVKGYISILARYFSISNLKNPYNPRENP